MCLVGDSADGGESVEVQEVVEGVAERDPDVAEGLADGFTEDGHDLAGAAAHRGDGGEDERDLHHLRHSATEGGGAWLGGRG